MIEAPLDHATARAWRKAERARLIAARLAMPETERQAASAAITQILTLDLLPLIAPQILGGYWPYQREFDCRAVLQRVAARGSRTALPVVVGKGTPLEFRPWALGDAMEAGALNIMHPATRETVAPDCLLIALVAFDARNYRLGYGGGYYDRTLAAMNPRPVTIGVGFEFQRLEDVKPHQHDVPLDYVVTEADVQIAMPPS